MTLSKRPDLVNKIRVVITEYNKATLNRKTLDPRQGLPLLGVNPGAELILQDYLDFKLNRIKVAVNKSPIGWKLEVCGGVMSQRDMLEVIDPLLVKLRAVNHERTLVGEV